MDTRSMNALFGPGNIPVIHKRGGMNVNKEDIPSLKRITVQDERALDEKNEDAFYQIDWGLIKNVPMLSTFHSVNPPAILINDRTPGYLLQKTYQLFNKDEETRGELFRIASLAKKDFLSRLILTDAYLDEEIDEDILNITNTIPLEPSLRSIILGLEQIDPRFIERYLQNKPDKGDVLDDDVAKAVITGLLLAERSSFADDVATSGRVEERILKDKRDMFPRSALEFFVSSTNEGIRKEVACLPDLSDNVGMFLGLNEPSESNLKKLASCTSSCDVLDAIEVNDNVTRSVMYSVNARRRDLGCQ